MYGPFAFGYSYNLSRDELGLPSLIFWIYSAMLVVSLLIALYPLRRLLNRLEGTGTVYSFQYVDEKRSLSMASLRSTVAGDMNGYHSVGGDYDQ